MRYSFAIPVILALTACGGNPIEFEPQPILPPPVEGELGEEAPIVGVQVPAIIAGHLREAEYSPGSPTLRIDLRTLDGSPLRASYQRAANLDVAGFEAYTIQETASQRKFLALFQRGRDGQGEGVVDAGVVADGGQFVNYFAGATFTQLKPMTMPSGDKLLATYTGGYVGLLNTGPSVDGSEDLGNPRQSARVEGDVMINADFNAQNLSLNGQITNRSIIESGYALENVYFEVAEINGQGAFSGVLKTSPRDAVGNYAGTFGGSGASHVAGATVLRPIAGDSELREHGSFVAQRCAAGDAAPCPPL